MVSPTAGLVVRRHDAPDQVLDTGQVDVYSDGKCSRRFNS
jgi:hypothetical protein